jgi:hypothetical protein
LRTRKRKREYRPLSLLNRMMRSSPAFFERIQTAAIDGDASSPGAGWVTSAPKIIVGKSVNKCILLFKASSRTVLRPPTYVQIVDNVSPK